MKKPLTRYTKIITAAGGNGTAIQVIKQPLTRAEYASRGKTLGKEMEPFGAEQAGFLAPSLSHFEMAGGEFCGNASRAAAVLLSQIKRQPKITFSVSGFQGTVEAAIKQQSDKLYSVRCRFPGLPITITPITIADKQMDIVDLDGIVHIIIKGAFPKQTARYQESLRDLVRQLKLEEREAVGVIWIDDSRRGVTMQPVVWVKDVDTCFYEQSCGSGAIAVSCVTGVSDIIQPTGKIIKAKVSKDTVTLESIMEIIR